MQSDTEYDVEIVGRDQAKHTISSLIKGYSQGPQTGGQQRPWRLKPSSTMWRFLLFIGDGVLFIVLFAFFLYSARNLQSWLGGAIFELEDWYSKLIWVYLIFASWSIAANLIQTQSISNVTSRFKGLLPTHLALISTFTLLTLFSYHSMLDRMSSYIAISSIFLIVAILTFCLWHIFFVEIMNLSPFLPRAVVVGTNKAGVSLADELLKTSRPRLIILRYISSASENLQIDEEAILRDRNTLPLLIQNDTIDMIIMATDYNTAPELYQLAFEAAQQGIPVVPIKIVYERISGKIPAEYIVDQWYEMLQSEYILSPLYLCWKKTFDLICSLCGLVVLCLVLPLITLLIYLDSPGPIFYSQERIGLWGKPFRIYKFRSMHINAESEGRAMWATEHDKRVTRVGRFLRATHLDELPQLFNILRGDMSLIGPRPERVEFVTELEKIVPFYHYRLAVKPGLTGWAQVKYHYARTDNDAVIKLQYDLYYIKWRSFMLDLFIILKTVSEVIFLRGT